MREAGGQLVARAALDGHRGVGPPTCPGLSVLGQQAVEAEVLDVSQPSRGLLPAGRLGRVSHPGGQPLDHPPARGHAGPVAGGDGDPAAAGSAVRARRTGPWSWRSIPPLRWRREGPPASRCEADPSARNAIASRRAADTNRSVAAARRHHPSAR